MPSDSWSSSTGRSSACCTPASIESRPATASSESLSNSCVGWCIAPCADTYSYALATQSPACQPVWHREAHSGRRSAKDVLGYLAGASAAVHPPYQPTAKCTGLVYCSNPSGLQHLWCNTQPWPYLTMQHCTKYTHTSWPLAGNAPSILGQRVSPSP